MFAAHDLSNAALGGQVGIENGQFIDGYGRTLSLRGLNVSGASKLPTKPNGLTHLTDGFYDHRTVTFVGRPFPIEEAPLHFRRLQAWGLPLVRLLVTWESIGHSGPNPDTDLDLEYISYLRELITLMPSYGIKCFICAHQDVWSRFSGGSGAPGWTFEAAGLDIEAFTHTGAAYVHGQDERNRANIPVNDKEPGGPFMWPSGYQKLAASTMATLFWAGDALAPKLKCLRLNGDGVAESVSIQSFLQDAFIEAFGKLADEVGGLESCLGFEAVNEPHRGLINLHDFHAWKYDTDLHIGHCPSLVESFALGSGYAQNVNYYVKSWPHPTRVSHRSLIDPKGRSAWLPHDSESAIDRPRGLGQCVWRAHGIWEWDEQKQGAVVTQRDYFDYDHRAGREGTRIEWYNDFYAPFLQRFTERVSRKCSHHLSFIEPIPNEFLPPWPSECADFTPEKKAQYYTVNTTITIKRPRNLVYAPHFYDLNVLFSKSHAWMSINVQGLARGMFILKALYFGTRGLRKNYRKQIGTIVKYAHASLGMEVPTLIGEVGIPFDIHSGTAFKTGCYDTQRQLMHGLIGSMEDSLVGFTLWNYNPHNRVEYGDGWNMEDFSVINGDEIVEDGPVRSDYRNRRHENDELYRGGRTLDVVIRPYAVKIAGQPIRSNWDCRTLRFDFEWESLGRDDKAEKTDKYCLTEVFLPNYHYAEHQIRVKLSDGEWSFDSDKQTLYIRHRAHSGGIVHHSLVVELQDVQKHLIQTVRLRRDAFPPRFPLNLIPPIVEVWWSGLDLRHVFWLLLMIIIKVMTRYVWKDSIS